MLWGFANETWRWQRSGHRLQAARSVPDASGPRRAEETPGHGPLDRWKGQTKLADDMVRWTDGKVKPAWRREWSVGPMEGSNQADARHSPLDRWKVKRKLARTLSVGSIEKVRRPAPLAPMKRSNQVGARHGPWCRRKSQNQAGPRHGPLVPMKRSNQAGGRHLPLGAAMRGLPWFCPVAPAE